MEEEKKGDVNQDMTDESQAAAATSMINTSGAPRGGVLIGSNDPNVVLADITDEDDRRGALAFLADQEKKSKFRDRLSMELDKVKKRAHHTRAKIRVKMPDGYILQGTFGAKEKVEVIYEFVRNCVINKERTFYLF